MAVLLLLDLKKQIHARMSTKDTNKEVEGEETLANEPTQETPVEAEVVVEDDLVDKSIDAIIKSTNTNRIGDGKIFVSNIEKVIRIRTRETGSEAL